VPALVDQDRARLHLPVRNSCQSSSRCEVKEERKGERTTRRDRERR
jgi:hypothetical protein